MNYPTAGIYALIVAVISSASCGGTTASPPTCAGACMHVARTNCPQQQSSSEPECESQCSASLGALREMGCGSQVDALLSCVGSANLVCDATGNVDYSPCGAQIRAEQRCQRPTPPGCESVPYPTATSLSCSAAGPTGVQTNTLTCGDGKHTWTSTCTASMCTCAYDGQTACTCSQPDSGGACCPGL